jgi:hypothetical protein
MSNMYQITARGGTRMRLQVKEFAEAMEDKLTKHDGDYGKTGWLNPDCTTDYLFERLNEEIEEARQAMVGCDKESLADECVDIANFAMMIRNRAITHTITSITND